MTGFGLLFVPFVGGYLFVTQCHFTRFISRRESGHRLVFRSAAVGLVLVAIARFLAHWLGSLMPTCWVGAKGYLSTIAPFDYIGTVALAFVLGPTTAFLVNRFFSESEGTMRAVHHTGNSMELLFVRSMESDSLVELTLNSGEVYAGWILNAGVAEPERTFVEILPLVSGFRAQETQETRFTVNYAASLDQDGGRQTVAPEDLRVVVPANEVRTARPFNSAR